MTTYFITFTNIFEATAFKEFLDTTYGTAVRIHYFNYKACSISPLVGNTIIARAFENNIISRDSIVKYKQVRKGVTRYPILKF